MIRTKNTSELKQLVAVKRSERETRNSLDADNEGLNGVAPHDVEELSGLVG